MVVPRIEGQHPCEIFSASEVHAECSSWLILCTVLIKSCFFCLCHKFQVARSVYSAWLTLPISDEKEL